MSLVPLAIACWLVTMNGVPGRAASLQQDSKPTFKAGIDLVTITAVVRDRKGHVVRDLGQKDFDVFERGRRLRIVEFSAGESGPVSLAILFDVSGSMRVASKVDGARHAADHILSWLEPGTDEAALYTFESELKEVQPFTQDATELHRALESLEPFGATSLYDAIAEAARRAADRTSRRRALVVLTDGIDTSSRLSPSVVSSIASSIDMPVYVLAVVSPLDHPGAETAVDSEQGEAAADNLANLAAWTGGDLFVISAPSHATVAARQLLSELRHQYVIALEVSADPGWHPLDVRVHRKNVVVRTRSGYVAGRAAPLSQR